LFDVKDRYAVGSQHRDRTQEKGGENGGEDEHRHHPIISGSRPVLAEHAPSTLPFQGCGRPEFDAHGSHAL
jgi:hypothetical protein